MEKANARLPFRSRLGDDIQDLANCHVAPDLVEGAIGLDGSPSNVVGFRDGHENRESHNLPLSFITKTWGVVADRRFRCEGNRLAGRPLIVAYMGDFAQANHVRRLVPIRLVLDRWHCLKFHRGRAIFPCKHSC